MSLDTQEARQGFLRNHIEELYAELTAGFTRAVPVEELVFEAANKVPGLVPTRETIAEERQLRQAEKRGAEIDQGIFLSHVLASARAGRHLIGAMLKPRPEALKRLSEFQASGVADLDVVRVERRGGIGYVELRNLRYLNAEDGPTTAALEIGVDLVLLDPECRVGALRGGVVDHPRHAGRRIFNSGLNLTHLYNGQISFVDFMIARELGLVGKIYRGHSVGDDFEPDLEETREKPWIAAVEAWAIGGGCQLLLVVDRVIAERGSYFNLPARKEGIIPGCANARLSRLVGERVARQAIMFERAFPAESPHGALLCDRIVEGGEAIDAAIQEDAAQLMSSGAVSTAANRKALRAAAEPVDAFRRYMAVYSREQALCMYSPAMIDNLERNWDAKRRRD